MAIKAYVGRMGSGKSYEVATGVIVKALARGRRVISNIAGLNYDEMRKYLISTGVSPEKIGMIVQVPHDAVEQSGFWLTDGSVPIEVRLKGMVLRGHPTPHEGPKIEPGDLLALDEVWRFWDGFAKPPSFVMNFFRMHRHFTHSETGVSCDVVLITQDIMDIGRKVRAVIEETYSMEKLTAIGSTKRYRVDICQRGQTRKILRSLQCEYNPDLFIFYSSHSTRKEGDAEAVEENIDKRGNLLSGAIFKIVIPLGILVFGGCAVFLYSFFHPKEPTPKEALAETSATGAATKPQNSQNQNTPEVTEKWRVVGHFNKAGAFLVVLTNAQNAIRILENPPEFKLSGRSIEVVLPEGGFATSWTTFARESKGILP